MITDLYEVNQRNLVPTKPGVYRFYDKQFNVIYVGKAKNLKKRVSSYFTKQIKDGKTKTLVKNIFKLDFTVVETEYDALLMENNFIKFHQPKYNILLKDDKSYPWIKVTNEPFPRIFSTRKKLKDGGAYFGPYTNVKKMHLLLEVIHDIFKLRSCNLHLNIPEIERGKFSDCLDFHIKKCNAPCIAKQTITDYNDKISQAISLINGEFSKTKKFLNSKMLDLARKQEFEQAQSVKLLLHKLVEFYHKSSVVHGFHFNADVFIWDIDEDHFLIHYMLVKEGALVNSLSRKYKIPINSLIEESLASVFFEIRRLFESEHKTVLTNKTFNTGIGQLSLIVPQKGHKKSILDLALKNLKYFKLQKSLKDSHKKPNESALDRTKDIQLRLGLDKLPKHIECFDNSNLQGSNPGSACVVFKNGVPSNKEYRHYKIKSVQGPDDFKSMEEVVFRRYSRMRRENLPLPELVVIDGGKGQLGAALTSIRALGLENTIQLIGLAKRMEEIYFPGETLPRILDRRSIALKTLQHIRNEAHRFSLKFHRNQRSRKANESQLDGIKGIGEKTKQKLITHFKSVQNLSIVNLQELSSVVGLTKAKLIRDFFDQPH